MALKISRQRPWKEQTYKNSPPVLMVYAFVNRSHGYIKCDSEVGISTTFRIYLPKKDSEQLEATPHGNETILVVDDKEYLRELAKKMLEFWGYRVLTAGDGNQALRQLATHPKIDFLFSDIVMPNGINGYDLAEKVIAIHNNIKVLFTSGLAEKAESHDKHIRFNTGMFNKPYHQVDLIKQVRAALDETKNS